MSPRSIHASVELLRSVVIDWLGQHRLLLRGLAGGAVVLASTSALTHSVAVTAPVLAPTVTVAAEAAVLPVLDRDQPDRSLLVRLPVDPTADDTFAAPPPPSVVKPNGSAFVSPVPGPITGGFGMRFHPILHYTRMHNGVDMTAACGTAVVASYRGTVIEAGWNGGYGQLVVIDHGVYQGHHLITKYAHLSRIGVRVGQKVETGDGIALSGTTGLSTACHLHFEVKSDGVYVDPGPFLTGKPSPRPTVPIEDLTPSTPTPSVTPTASPSGTPSPSATPTRSPKPTPKPTPSPSDSPSDSPSPVESPSPSQDPDPTPTPSPDPEPSQDPAPSSEPPPSSDPSPESPSP